MKIEIYLSNGDRKIIRRRIKRFPFSLFKKWWLRHEAHHWTAVRQEITTAKQEKRSLTWLPDFRIRL